MTYEQYWYGDPLMVRAFFKADKMCRERNDYEAWLQGAYFKSAIESTVGNMFSGKNAEKVSYPAQPYTVADREEKEKSKQKEQQEAAAAKLYMYNMIRAGKEWGNH